MATLTQINKNTILVVDTGIVYSFRKTLKHVDKTLFDVDSVQITNVLAGEEVIATDDDASQLWRYLNELCINGDDFKETNDG